jgi:hypothetical protein
MKTYLKVLYVTSWVPILLLHSTPLVMVAPFMDIGWYAILPVGLVFLGLIMVPICLATTGGDFTGMFWLWGNDEEHYPDWWAEEADERWYTSIFPRFWWYAIRNPVNNLRFIFKDREANIVGWGPQSMEATDLITHKVRSASRWAYNGPFAGYRRIWLNGDNRYSEIWFGWKVGSSVPGMGFTAQVRLKRLIGQ